MEVSPEQGLCWVLYVTGSPEPGQEKALKTHSPSVELSRGPREKEQKPQCQVRTLAFTFWAGQAGWGWGPCLWGWQCPRCWLSREWRWGSPSRCSCGILLPSWSLPGDPVEPPPPQSSLCFKQTQKEAIRKTFRIPGLMGKCTAWAKLSGLSGRPLAQASETSKNEQPHSLLLHHY